jgi:small conductance mechanosensitive channel
MAAGGMTMEEKTLEFFGEVSDLVLIYAFDVVGAVVLLIGGWIVAGWARRSLLRVMERAPRIDPTLRPVFASLVRYTILIFVLIAVLAQFGVQTTSIIALLGAAGLAVGLALQGTLQNIAAGIMLLFLRPFRVGDYVDAEGIAGTVNEIGLFTTVMHTFDGVYLEVPNSQLWNRSIKNYSRLPTRRVDVGVGISYSDDIDKAFGVLMEILRSDERVHAEPEPQVMVTALADSSVNLNMRCWCDAADYWGMLFDLHKVAKERLDAAGISIPFPQRDVHMIKAEA